MLIKRHRGQHRPLGYCSQQLDPIARGLPPWMRAISAAAALTKSTEEIVMGCPLIIYVPHAIKALLNSHLTKHLSASCLTSHEILWLTSPHITLSHCNNLNTASRVLLPTDETPHDYLTLTDQLLILRADLQETTIANAEILWFIDGSYLKNGKGKYCAKYAITSSFEAILRQLCWWLLLQHNT